MGAALSPRFVSVRHRRTGVVLLPQARWCASYLSRLRGLMFRRVLLPGEALVLDERRDSRTATSIHMFFVPFPIAAVWVDSTGRVVDKVLALPWRPFYAPRLPARYILETSPEFLARIQLDDELEFEARPATAEP
jgi:uncharacterized membrane protein (UPF0127 family)